MKKKTKKVRTEPYKRNGVIYERIYELIIYDEDNIDVENFIPEDYKVKQAYISHDKDIKEDGQPKKKHIHLILWFDREKSIKALSKELNFPINRIKWKADIYGTLQYLIHKNNPEKAQYDYKEIHSDIDGLYEYIYPTEKEEVSEEDDLRVIMSYVQNHIGTLRLYDIYCFAVDNGVWSSYRRNYTIIKDILMEERYIERNRLTHILYHDNKIDGKTGEVDII